MQSYHSSLLLLCETCATLAKTRTAAGSDLDSAFCSVNSQRRTLRLSGPQISKSSCLDALLEHACYLLRVQRDGTEQGETAWVTDAVVGQYLEVTASTSFVVTKDLRWSSESRFRHRVKHVGILQLLTGAANTVTEEAAAATPETLRSSCIVMSTGIIDLWDAVCSYWQDQDEIVGHESLGQLVPQRLRPAKTLEDQFLGQLTRAVLRMILQLLPLISSRSAHHPADIRGKFLHDFAQVVGPVSVRAAVEIECRADDLTAAQQSFCSDPDVLQAIAIEAVLTVMQLRKLQAESRVGAGAPSSTTAAAAAAAAAEAEVPCHHVSLLRVLQLGDAVEALIQAAHTRPSMSPTDAVRAAKACREVYMAAIYVLSNCNSRGSSSRSNNTSNASNNKQGWLEYVTSNQQPVSQGWPDATISGSPPKPAASRRPSDIHLSRDQQAGQQQLLQDLLDLLPHVFGVLLELQLLAQQLHHVACQLQNLGNRPTPSNIVWESYTLEDAQQWAVAAMTWIYGDYSDGLVDMLLSQPQQPQGQVLGLEAVSQCCNNLHTAMRAFGTVGANKALGPLIEQLNRLLLWLASSPASSQQSGGVSSSITIPDVCSLLLTWLKCEAAWLQTVSSRGTGGTPSNTSAASDRNSNTGGTQRLSDRAIGDDTDSIMAYNMAYSLKPVYELKINSRADARVHPIEKLPIMIYLMLLTADTAVRVAGARGTPAAAAGLQVDGSSSDSAAAAGLMLAGRCLYMAGEMTIKGKHLMQPDMAIIHSPTLANGKYVSIPWEPVEEMLVGLDVLLPLLKLPGTTGAAQAAATKLQDQYRHLKHAVLEGRTGKLSPLQGGLPATKQCVLALASEHDTTVAERMSSFGAALCAQLPMSWCCNNPSCLKLSSKSEQKLVSGKKCAGCKQATYCGPECQKEHWDQQHKPVCKILKKLCGAGV